MLSPPRSLLLHALNTFKFTSLPSSLGNSPAAGLNVNTTTPFSTDAELTSDRIVRDIEVVQICEFAELLRQLSCKKVTISTRNLKRSDRMLSSPRRELHDTSKVFKLTSLPSSLGKPAKSEVIRQNAYIVACMGAISAPVSWLCDTSRTVKLERSPRTFGSSPERTQTRTASKLAKSDAAKTSMGPCASHTAKAVAG